MAHDDNINHQWSAEPIRVKSNNPCNAVRPSWPMKLCTLHRGHEGKHCNAQQAGNKIIELWWEREDDNNDNITA